MSIGRPGSDDPLTPAERQFLIDAGLPSNAFDPEVMREARAHLRERAERTRREAAADLSCAQVAGLLGCTVDEVLAWAANNDLYAYEAGAGLRFPEWQFPDGQRIPGLGLVLSSFAVRTQHPYSVEGFMALVPHEELGWQTVVEWLIGGGAPGPATDLAAAMDADP